MTSEAFTVIYNKGLDLVSRREHSRHELMQKLDKRFPETMPIIEEALDKLVINKILDDERFAEMYVNSRARKGFGPKKIEMELYSKKVDAMLISDALEAYEAWTENAKNEFQKDILHNKNIIDIMNNTHLNEIKIRDNNINDLKNDKQLLLNKIDELNNTINNMQNNINKKFDTFYNNNIHKTNTQIGIDGELCVEQYLNDKFCNAQLENTTGLSGMGDLRLHFESINCLIEVKNVKAIKSNDIQKFYDKVACSSSFDKTKLLYYIDKEYMKKYTEHEIHKIKNHNLYKKLNIKL